KLTYMVDGELYKEYTLDFGATVTPEVEPTKEGHTFSGWSEIPQTMPANDVTVTGTFSVNKYKLTYMVDGEVYKEYTLDFGSTVTPESEPSREGHTFSGWSEIPETMPAHDIEVYGYYIVNRYTLTIYLNDEVYSTEELEYGSPIQLDEPAVPEGMKFDGWITEIPDTMPDHDLDVYGSYSEINAVDFVLSNDSNVTVFDLRGNLIVRNSTWIEIKDLIPNGIYIVNGKKVLIGR
ncbi:MAG: InlB B-repeat-containing protein, partial [Muribaculum sp.]|nr:InlB B-repeat-containing protein [Muribaculum sp.]